MSLLFSSLMLMLSYLYSFKLLHISVYERITAGIEDTKTILIIRKFREKKRQKKIQETLINQEQKEILHCFFWFQFLVYDVVWQMQLYF